MHLSKPLFFLLLISLLISEVSLCAKAADKLSPSLDSQSYASHQNSAQSERFDVTRHQSGLLISPGGDLVAGDANVCYTMRSYKVKRTERLAANESGVTGYSTCEMAATYKLRSTERQATLNLK
jgi:hypothetical protein